MIFFLNSEGKRIREKSQISIRYARWELIVLFLNWRFVLVRDRIFKNGMDKLETSNHPSTKARSNIHGNGCSLFRYSQKEEGVKKIKSSRKDGRRAHRNNKND